MKKKLLFILLSLLVIIACNNSGTKKEKKELTKEQKDSIAYADSIEVAEKDSIERERFVKDSLKISNSIRVFKYYTHNPNSAGGVSASINFKNISDKEIKYVTFYVQVYNAVDDQVYCTITNECMKSLQVTGPIKPGATKNAFWDCLWYNSTIGYMVITKIEIEYMDNSEVIIPEKKLKYIGL
jgi:hypothetical protein